MKHLLTAFFLLLCTLCFSQKSKIKPDKYPSLLWEIRGKGMTKPSYLFGTMHVSSKMAFNLSDSFYIGIRTAQVVALETNPGTWQEDFSRYDLEGEISSRFGGRFGYGVKDGYTMPRDYLTVNTLKLTSYEKMMEAALYSNPSIINNFLYRSNSEASSDFEEDTYLDLHIFQAGKKLGKRICGVENFDGSMQLVKEAYADAAKEKNKKEKSYDIDDELSYQRLEEAYRTGNLDLLDTINKVNSRSAAFDEKFLYRRNEIQASSIDSILKKGLTLFVGVGAAHLPGERGVIEMLRRMGYTLRPIKMKLRDGRHKEAIEKIRVPVQFSKQVADDGFYTVNVPGKLYSFGPSFGSVQMQQYADMTNGSYYMVSRLFTNAALIGHDEAQVERKIDSVLYENIPGKILSKKVIGKNGYKGFEITNRTRRGDYQHYNIFVTPFEIIIFKMSGNGEYVKLGTEATQFFNSIQLKEHKAEWKKFRPSYGGFESEFPHEPQVFERGNWIHAAYDATTKTAYQVVRSDVHNYEFLEEDSFDLSLMEESFASSDFVQRQLSRKAANVGGFPALDVKYKFKDSSVATVRYVINGPRYYTIVAKGPAEHKGMQQFIQSFQPKPFVYGEAKKETDTALFYTVKTPVPLYKKQKLAMYPDGGYYNNYYNGDDDDSLVDNGKYVDHVIANDSTGEKIYVLFYKTSQYYQEQDNDRAADSLDLGEDRVVRRKKIDTLADKTIVSEYEIGSAKSSRLLKAKAIEKNGFGYRFETMIDTIMPPSSFITSFFQTLTPVDTVKGVDVKSKKTTLFFSQLFSNDTLLRKTAIKNISNITIDSSDVPQIKQAISSLNWKDKKYLEVKKSFIEKLAEIPAKNVSDYLKDLYFTAGDTVDLQYIALETLLRQRTAYAYKTFAGIVENDPPVLGETVTTTDAGYGPDMFDRTFNTERFDYSDGSFMDNLIDSLALTAGIYRNLLPLINLDDYEHSIMNLTEVLIDSNLIAAKDYEAYLSKFVIEAKQLLKKQLIKEKTRSIEKAKESEEEQKNISPYGNDNGDDGNTTLSRYASLLLPFWDQHPQVPQIIRQMLASNDKRLKYNTAISLLRAKRPVPDSTWRYFAGLDEFRFELYKDLKTLNRLDVFPSAQKNQLAISKSQLLSEASYKKPDTIVFIEKVPLAYKGRGGFVYVYKYKDSKDDNSWKLATVGLLPKDSSMYEFEQKPAAKLTWQDKYKYDFTKLSQTKLTDDTPQAEQIQKLLKKLLYSKRKSAAQFYPENENYGGFDLNYFRD